MKITHTPVNSPKPSLAVSAYGETVVVDGEAFDLSAIPAGGSLPVPHDLVHQAQREEDGTLHIEVPRFYLSGPAPDETTEDLPDEGEWTGKVVVVSPPTQAEKDAANTLSPRRFTYMLHANGDPAWKRVWDAAEAHLEENDREAWSRLAAQKASGQFSLGATLDFVASMKPITDQFFPDADLSEATIRTAWEAAKEAEGL